MNKTEKFKLVLAATGASGVRLSFSFLKKVLKIKEVEQLFFIYSKPASEVFQEEENRSFKTEIDKLKNKKLKVYENSHLSAEISSGSFLFSAMVILPASMATIGALSSGAGDCLIHRVADVCLKEERKLIICPRESPFSLIHLRNMVLLKQAGATILPFIPQYYTKPKTIEDLESNFFQRILDHLNISNNISTRWSSK